LLQFCTSSAGDKFDPPERFPVFCGRFLYPVAQTGSKKAVWVHTDVAGKSILGSNQKLFEAHLKATLLLSAWKLQTILVKSRLDGPKLAKFTAKRFRFNKGQIKIKMILLII